MSIMSIIALVVSILGFFIYVSLLSGSGLIWLFIIVGLASIILPLIAKKIRLNHGKKGRALEIAAIVVGGLNFYFIIFALTTFPLLIGYLGWVISGIVYRKIK